MNKYVYNPGVAPQHVGHMILAPKNFSVKTEAEVNLIVACGIPVIIEGAENFVSPFAVYNPKRPQRN